MTTITLKNGYYIEIDPLIHIMESMLNYQMELSVMQYGTRKNNAT